MKRNTQTCNNHDHKTKHKKADFCFVCLNGSIIFSQSNEKNMFLIR